MRDYDLMPDSLGGQALENSLQAAPPGGLVIGIAGPPDPDFARQPSRPLLRSVLALLTGKIRSLARRRKISYAFLFMRAAGTQLNQITALVDAGAIHPVLDRVCDFSDTLAALDYVKTGRAKGKVVITMT